MHAVPIPAELLAAFEALFAPARVTTTVIGESDPTRDDVRPCEYVVTPSDLYPGRPRVWALIELSDEDRAAVARGGRVVLSLDGGELPWSLDVWEPGL